MNDGTRYAKSVEYPKGEPQKPFSKQDHVDKLTNMALWIGIGHQQINELLGTIDTLEKVDHISKLTRLLVP
jgi:hypothetical protein